MRVEKNRLLVVVDYQNDFVDGSLGFAGAKELEARICAKIDEARACGEPVVFTLDTHLDNYLYTQEGKNLPVSHCVKGTEGWRIYGEVARFASEYPRLEKNTFGSRALLEYLLSQPHFDEIELVGLVTNLCVLSNAVIIKTASPESLILVDARCVASNDPLLHEKALDLLENLQVRVTGRSGNEPA